VREREGDDDDVDDDDHDDDDQISPLNADTEVARERQVTVWQYPPTFLQREGEDDDDDDDDDDDVMML